jgi:hypothetical protein
LQSGGRSLLKRHDGSQSKLLAAVFPEYDWLPWKFSVTPKNYWDDPKNQKRFIEWAAKELNVNQPEEWNNITLAVITGYEKYLFEVFAKFRWTI